MLKKTFKILFKIVLKLSLFGVFLYSGFMWLLHINATMPGCIDMGSKYIKCGFEGYYGQAIMFSIATVAIFLVVLLFEYFDKDS
jgi:hypothetical protein